MRVVANGLLFPEGPVALGGGAVLVTETRAGRLTRCTDAATEVVAQTATGPNGAARDRNGRVYVANNGGVTVGPHGYWRAEPLGDGAIQRVDPDGSVVDLVTVFPEAEPPVRPNDICFGPDGALYVTDPANWEDLANLRSGRLWRVQLDGRLDLLAEIPLFPNGIAFGPDGRSLFVAQTMARAVLRFEWTPDGVGKPREWCRVPSGFPDGLCFSANGDSYVCGSMGDVLHVFDGDGRLKDTIELDQGTEPTNCCIADGLLYVTLSGTGQLGAIPIEADPLPLFG